MNQARSLSSVVLLLLVSLAGGGCAGRGDKWHDLPSMDVEWPALQMTQEWDGQRYEAPVEPVYVPRETLEPGLARWRQSFASDWHVMLPDGRRAIVWTPRDAGVGGTMDRITVYRADGTLQHEQWNYDGRLNAPGRWRTYEADGRTPSIEVQARHGSVTDVIFYENGRKAQQLLADENGVIHWDYRFGPDGNEVVAHPTPAPVSQR